MLEDKIAIVSVFVTNSFLYGMHCVVSQPWSQELAESYIGRNCKYFAI
jgi:hypothetical protein